MPQFSLEITSFALLICETISSTKFIKLGTYQVQGSMELMICAKIRLYLFSLVGIWILHPRSEGSATLSPWVWAYTPCPGLAQDVRWRRTKGVDLSERNFSQAEISLKILELNKISFTFKDTSLHNILCAIDENRQSVLCAFTGENLWIT